MRRMDERMQTMVKLQKLIAERQLNELRDDGGSTHQQRVAPSDDTTGGDQQSTFETLSETQFCDY